MFAGAITGGTNITTAVTAVSAGDSSPGLLMSPLWLPSGHHCHHVVVGQ